MEDKSGAEDVSRGRKVERRWPHFRALVLVRFLGGEGDGGALGRSCRFVGVTTWLVRVGEPRLRPGNRSWLGLRRTGDFVGLSDSAGEGGSCCFLVGEREREEVSVFARKNLLEVMMGDYDQASVLQENM